MQIEEILISESKYPDKLKKIYDPPHKIYVLGNRRLLYEKGIAIVGAREATEYGKKVAYNFAKDISNNGIVVISGLAVGIDEYAHIGALHGKTIAVLGSGIDKMYPRKNIGLAREIIRNGGCIISEYPLGTKPERLHFPQRNRIISGLSDGVVVVEASTKSGALITADFALEQGKEVFAVPGDICKKQSEGTNKLIQEGAVIVTSSKEILDYIK